MNIRPIKTDGDYNAALRRIAEIMDAEPGTPEVDELDVLASLVEQYEAKRFPIDVPSPVDAVRFRMEQANLSVRDLVPIIGSRARVSEVLSAKRPLTLQMIRSLHEHLGIPADALLKQWRPRYLESPTGEVGCVEQCYPAPMSSETQALLEAFEHLSAEEKRAFTEEVLRRSLPFDSGALADEEVSAASDALWQALDEGDDDSPAR